MCLPKFQSINVQSFICLFICMHNFYVCGSLHNCALSGLAISHCTSLQASHIFIYLMQMFFVHVYFNLYANSCWYWALLQFCISTNAVFWAPKCQLLLWAYLSIFCPDFYCNSLSNYRILLLQSFMFPFVVHAMPRYCTRECMWLLFCILNAKMSIIVTSACAHSLLWFLLQ
jgi:hypothetical protein